MAAMRRKDRESSGQKEEHGQQVIAIIQVES